jgi:hypothetical protein
MVEHLLDAFHKSATLLEAGDCRGVFPVEQIDMDAGCLSSRRNPANNPVVGIQVTNFAVVERATIKSFKTPISFPGCSQRLVNPKIVGFGQVRLSLIKRNGKTARPAAVRDSPRSVWFVLDRNDLEELGSRQWYAHIALDVPVHEIE